MGGAPGPHAIPEDRAPHAVITSPADTSAWGGVPVTLSGEVSDAEDPPASLAAWWESSVDGTLVDEEPAGPEGFVSGSALLSEGEHVLTLWVRDTAGNLGSAKVDFTVGAPVPDENTPPTVQLMAPESASVVNEGEPVAFEALVSDAEDAPDTLLLRWESDLDGVLGAQGADSAGEVLLSANRLSPGLHTVTVTVTDLGGLSSADTTSFTVNRPPSAPVVRIAPEPAATADDLVASIDVPSTDPEGGSITYAYTWELDGAATLVTTDTVAAADTAKGQRWRVVVTPSDAHGAGVAGASELVVGNTPPEARWSDLTAGDVYTDDVLSASALGSDADLDPVLLTRTWTIDGTVVPWSDPTLDGAVFFDKDQVVTVEILPHDGTEPGVPLTQSWTVLNTPPTAPVVRMEPASATVDDDLLCWIETPSTDADGDLITYGFAWDVDGVSFGGAGTTWEAGDTVIAAETGPGELWTCTVSPDDGVDPGTTASATAELCDPAPVRTAMGAWTSVDYPVTADPVSDWRLSADQRVVGQLANANPAVFASDFTVTYGTYAASVRVDTDYDDDFIGFVLGFDPGDVAGQTFLLIDWKQSTQAYDFGCGAVSARQGLAASTVVGVPTGGEFWGHAEDPCSTPAAGVVELQRGRTLGDVGWVDETTAAFLFEVERDRLRVFVDGTLELDLPGDHSGGRLGFYAFSQEDVRFQTAASGCQP